MNSYFNNNSGSKSHNRPKITQARIKTAIFYAKDPIFFASGILFYSKGVETLAKTVYIKNVTD